MGACRDTGGGGGGGGERVLGPPGYQVLLGMMPPMLALMGLPLIEGGTGPAVTGEDPPMASNLLNLLPLANASLCLPSAGAYVGEECCQYRKSWQHGSKGGSISRWASYSPNSVSARGMVRGKEGSGKPDRAGR